MTLDQSSREELLQCRLNQAREAADEVEFLIANNHLNLAINRIYYTIFYLLSAIALKEEFVTSKHQQLIGWFNKNYISTGIVDKKFGALVHNAYDKRTKCDYDYFVSFNIDEVIGAQTILKDFIVVVNKLTYGDR